MGFQVLIINLVMHKLGENITFGTIISLYECIKIRITLTIKSIH
jgi:hypothetical protein